MKKLIFLLMIILLSGIWIFIGLKTNQENLKVLTYKENVNLVKTFEKTETLEYNIYFSTPSSYYTKKNNIVHCSVKDSDNELSINIASIIQCNKCKIDDSFYYQYLYIFSVDYSSDEEMIFNDAQIIIEYDHVDSLKVNVGNLLIKKIPFSHDQNNILEMSSLEGMTKEINKRTTLVGLVVKLKPNKEIKITDFSIFDCRAKVSKGEVKIIDRYDDMMQIDEVLGYDFNNERINDSWNGINLKEETFLVIPVKLSDNLNATGFELTYVYNDTEYKFYYETFVFFNSLENNSEYVVLDYELY